MVGELLHETKAGSHVTSGAQLRALVIEAYTEFQRAGRVSYAGDENAIKRYTHVEMARKFASLLDMVVGGRQQ